MVMQWVGRSALRIALLGMGLTIGFPVHAAAASLAATQTALTVSTDNAGPRTKVTLTARVAETSGLETPTGVVIFQSNGSDLGSAVVDDEGNATVTTDNLGAGSHQVVAIYKGNATDEASISSSALVNAQAQSVAGFTVSANPTSLTIPAGSFGSSQVTITPVSGFNAYVSLSCSGLPVSTTCTFVPSNVLASCTTTGGQETCTPALSTIQIQTLAISKAKLRNPAPRSKSLSAYALAFPVLFGLAGLGARKNRAFWNVVLLLFLFAGAMAMTACKERYNYLNHGPTPNPGTPVGTYTFTINSVSTTGSLITTPPTSPQLTLTITGANKP